MVTAWEMIIHWHYFVTAGVLPTCIFNCIPYLDQF